MWLWSLLETVFAEPVPAKFAENSFPGDKESPVPAVYVVFSSEEGVQAVPFHFNI